ncbi:MULTISPECIES: type II secretion system major pseudopilin GspG [unclassified Pseudoalteromonas]|uniref:type II secretion system major pseudopilin GspG n=1 Tax=unclassified Pseudoalteromonas TaxID=194690 RepID=UPI001023C534|nr:MULTISPECIES: type II secretion system major pseudopilin GspG [Gammaproteobacteria]MCF7501024.1 type II secretion system major pseudopilin GspG [Pseudoalteromonas sp. L1]RZF91325.1 type II secretion system protein GspG [Pseudoalteromonas sp. CO302Y]RZG07058.1 type II secretion system protein GspG [Pseudoalteromonas sp. CO133X]UJX25892.1 type II secretion system major pseudopilin GspG [Pseudoalteromonas sp. CF6-2]MCF7519571.1 type II secretion system major pseudopilin GspG [Pseudoalteromonas|tara:strand:+ start:21068 stop:21463 length:396 start_codon:yes stop_codon:yes gene_type:complete
MKKNKGFSLMELMIVLIILGLLGSLVAPKLFSKVSSSKIKTAVAQMQMFETAIDTYRLDMGTVPPTLQALRRSESASWDGPYLPKDIPLDPWGKEYIYKVPGENGAPYTIMSYGLDGQPGGEGENEDVIHK